MTVFNFSRSAAVLLLLLSFIALYMLTAPLNLLTVCIHHYRDLTAYAFLLKLVTMLPNSLM